MCAARIMHNASQRSRAHIPAAPSRSSMSPSASSVVARPRPLRRWAGRAGGSRSDMAPLAKPTQRKTRRAVRWSVSGSVRRTLRLQLCLPTAAAAQRLSGGGESCIKRNLAEPVLAGARGFGPATAAAGTAARPVNDRRRPRCRPAATRSSHRRMYALLALLPLAAGAHSQSQLARSIGRRLRRRWPPPPGAYVTGRRGPRVVVGHSYT